MCSLPCVSVEFLQQQETWARFLSDHDADYSVLASRRVSCRQLMFPTVRSEYCQSDLCWEMQSRLDVWTSQIQSTLSPSPSLTDLQEKKQREQTFLDDNLQSVHMNQYVIELSASNVSSLTCDDSLRNCNTSFISSYIAFLHWEYNLRSAGNVQLIHSPFHNHRPETHLSVFYNSPESSFNIVLFNSILQYDIPTFLVWGKHTLEQPSQSNPDPISFAMTLLQCSKQVQRWNLTWLYQIL